MAEGLSNKQMQILTFPKTEYQALICDGAVRSGKTSVMTLAFVIWAMNEFNQRNFAICGKTVQSAVRNVITPLLSVRYLAKNKYHLAWSFSNHLLTVTRGKKTNYFYVFGGKDEGSAALIQGITLAGVFLDEVALMPRSFVEQALARCSVERSRFWFNCNPEAPSHWFYQEWILCSEEKKALHLHFLMADNPSLSPEVLERYYSLYSGVFYDRYIKGEWVRAEGIIYRKFADAFSSGSKEFFLKEKAPYQKINIGVDFGGNGSGHAFVATGITRGYKEVHGLASERYFGDDIDPVKLEILFCDFVERILHHYGYVRAVYADSAEQVLIRGLRKALQNKGLGHIPIYNALKSSIKDRINLVCRLIGQKRLYITEESETLKTALCSALWNSKAGKEDERLDDGTSDIDSLDAFEYSIENDTKRFLTYGG